MQAELNRCCEHLLFSMAFDALLDPLLGLASTSIFSFRAHASGNHFIHYISGILGRQTDIFYVLPRQHCPPPARPINATRLGQVRRGGSGDQYQNEDSTVLKRSFDDEFMDPVSPDS